MVINLEKLGDLVEEVKEMQNGVVEVLRDTIEDYRKRDFRKDITIYLLIIAFACTAIGLSVYHEWSFKKFLEQYDFQTITIEGTQDGGGINQMGGGDVTNGADRENSNQTNDTQGQ